MQSSLKKPHHIWRATWKRSSCLLTSKQVIVHPGLRWIRGHKWCHYDGFKGAATTQRSRPSRGFLRRFVLWSCLRAVEVSIGRTGPYMCVSINQGMFIRSAMCVPDSIKWVNSVWRYVSVRKETRGVRRGKKGGKKCHFQATFKVFVWKESVARQSVCLYLQVFVCFCFASLACRRRRLLALSRHIFLSLFTRDLVWSQRVDKHAREVRRSSKSNNQVGKLD